MLFRINVYRLGVEKRLEARRRIVRIALVAAVLGVNAIVLGLFVQAVFLTNDGISSTGARLGSIEQALGELVRGGGALTEDQLQLLEKRGQRISWSEVYETISRLVRPEMSFTRLKMGEDRSADRKDVVLTMRGRLKGSREEESVDRLMGFVQDLRDDEYVSRRFREVRLVSMDWSADPSDQFLEFEITCPIRVRQF